MEEDQRKSRGGIAVTPHVYKWRRETGKYVNSSWDIISGPRQNQPLATRCLSSRLSSIPTRQGALEHPTLIPYDPLCSPTSPICCRYEPSTICSAATRTQPLLEILHRLFHFILDFRLGLHVPICSLARILHPPSIFSLSPFTVKWFNSEAEVAGVGGVGTEEVVGHLCNQSHRRGETSSGPHTNPVRKHV